MENYKIGDKVRFRETVKEIGDWNRENEDESFDNDLFHEEDEEAKYLNLTYPELFISHIFNDSTVKLNNNNLLIYHVSWIIHKEEIMGDCSSGCGGCGSDCSDSKSTSDDYITGYSTFDRRENELTSDDVDCKFKVGDEVYNPNTREYGIVEGYKKMRGDLYIRFKITGFNVKKDVKLFSGDLLDKVYYVEPCFIVYNEVNS